MYNKYIFFWWVKKLCCEIFIEKKNIFMKIFEEGNWVKWWMNFFFYLLVDNIIINCKCMKIKKSFSLIVMRILIMLRELSLWFIYVFFFIIVNVNLNCLVNMILFVINVDL